MSSPTHRLTSLIKKAKRLREIDESFTRNFLATVREYLEITKAKESFPVTSLHCNWTLHTQISASLTALHSLGAITERLVQVAAGHSSQEDLIEFLSAHLFQTARLRAELSQILRQNKLPGYLTAIDENWTTFCGLIYADLLEKRLTYPHGSDLPPDPSDPSALRRAKAIFQNHLAAVGGNRRAVFRATWLSLSVDPWDDRPTDRQSAVFHVNVESFEGVTFRMRANGICTLPMADKYALKVPRQSDA